MADRRHGTDLQTGACVMSPLRGVPPPRTYTLPDPSVFGDLFPPKFTAWRGHDQCKAVCTTLDSDRRFIAQAAPTGFGKSFAYVGAALLGGLRTAILTSTKGLQEQLLADFNEPDHSRLCDIRGQNAYQCVVAQEFGFPQYTTCDYAPCHSGRPCRLKDGGCKYYDAYRKAQVAPIVVTNYAYWLSIHKYGQGLGQFDMLVLDEAHDAPDTLAEFMSVEIDPADLPHGMKLIDTGADIRQWKEWAEYNAPRLKQRYEHLQQIIRQSDSVPTGSMREASQIKRLTGKLEQLAEADDDWVIERVDTREGYKMRFDPVWPYQHAEKLLFRGIQKVVLVSATLRHKTCELLGIDEADLDFHEYDSGFPVARRPIIHVPTVQMNHRTPPENLRIWTSRIDQIVSSRLDRKGIVHTVSFARAKEIASRSEYSPFMLLNESRNTKWTVREYKQSSPPMILVSPSISTGYDFPYDECRYQVIGKLPFPDNRAKVVKARMEQDKEYGHYMTMQTLIQECGRGMRAEDDWCETLVLDDNFVWFMRSYAKFAPKWFKNAIVWATNTPPPINF